MLLGCPLHNEKSNTSQRNMLRLLGHRSTAAGVNGTCGINFADGWSKRQAEPLWDTFRRFYRFIHDARIHSISGLVVEYVVAIDVTRVRFPADAYLFCY